MLANGNLLAFVLRVPNQPDHRRPADAERLLLDCSWTEQSDLAAGDVFFPEGVQDCTEAQGYKTTAVVEASVVQYGLVLLVVLLPVVWIVPATDGAQCAARVEHHLHLLKINKIIKGFCLSSDPLLSPRNIH